jgi:predicted dienelactone hydrolase
MRALIFILALHAAVALADPYKPNGGVEVISTNLDWKDAARDRDVPVKIYRPRTMEKPCPIILFSHGLGGSRDNYAYLGNHWASHGYVSVHMQHVGSDTNVIKESPTQPMQALRAAAMDPKNALNRVLDVKFVLDQLECLDKDDAAWKGKLDLKHIGIAGHSFGAHTTLASVGQAMALQKEAADQRITAAIAMSAPTPALKTRTNLDRAYANIRVPVFHMTGTLDDSPISDSKAADRRIPFDHMTGVEQYLLIFTGGDHMIFSGRARIAGAEKRTQDEAFQNIIKQSSLAFWDAYLNGDAAAQRWLANGDLKTEAKSLATLEIKSK